jgi:tetratricopeptide (TPR) repeat protein
LVVFVGRGEELARFGGALTGEARMMLVVGDAGVGKTRFVGAGMRQAAGAGVVPLWGGCLPLAEKLPLLPVAQALGELRLLEGGQLLEAALSQVQPYARAEVARLVPGLGPGGPEVGGQGGEWQRERLFSGVAEVLAAVAGRFSAGLVVEDVHWADGATLDCLTFLLRVHGEVPLTVVATCRSDEVPLDAQVAGWLAHVRASAAVEEIRLGPLTQAEVGEQVAALVGGLAPGRFADEVYARGEGNPFFTEQLVAAARAGAAGSVGEMPPGLPARLAELLLARAGGCSQDGWAVLAALAVAGRPLTEVALGDVTGLGVDAVRGGLRELAAAKLLAESTADGAHRPRHALLAEAVAGALLPGERVVLHERMARALEVAGDETLAAEAAGHWAAAGQPPRELPARMAAGRAAERVFAYPQAAAHFQRAVELCRAQLGSDAAAGIDLPRLYGQAIDALEISGDSEHAEVLAEEAYSRFAAHPDRATAAAVHLRVAKFRMIDQPAAALALTEEAIRLAGPGPPSAAQAEAWYRYGDVFLETGEGDQEASRKALQRAVEIAEASRAVGLIPQILVPLADHALMRGEVEEALALLGRARALAEACGDGGAIVWVAIEESFTLDGLGKKEAGTEVALAGLRAARQLGHHDSRDAGILAGNACWGLTQSGRTAEAAALIDPLTTELRGRDYPSVQLCRVEIDMLRGDMDGAQGRLAQVKAMIAGRVGLSAGEHAAPELAAELSLWAGRPSEALDEITRALPSFTSPVLAYRSGGALTLGMRACADLAETARARQDPAAAALAAGDGLASWVEQVAGAPFADRPDMVYIPANRASWAAERARLAGANDPAVWGAAAKAWDGLSYPHRAAYAWWRQAEAQLDAGLPPPRPPPYCGPPQPPPTATRRYSPRSERSPAGPASPCRLRQPNPLARARPARPHPTG